MTDTPGTPETNETPEVPAVTETPETPEAPQATEAPEATDATETPETPTESSDTPEVPAEVAAAPETTEAPEEPEAAAAPAVAEAPKKAPAPKAKPKPTKAPSKGNWHWGTGRRKSAVARVRIRPGSGNFIINKKEIDNYFSEDRDRKDIRNVLSKTSTKDSLDIHVNVHGGGYMGQAGAIVLGLGRALKIYDPTLEPILRANNFLTRDDREVERKKPGQPGARKRFQFSKR